MKKSTQKIDKSAPVLEVEGVKYVRDAAGCYVPSSAIHSRTKVMRPENVIPYLSELRLSEVEQVWCLDLDGAHQVIEVRPVTKGLVNQAPIHAREVLRGAILNNATAIFLAHNHPSGSLEPSREDLAATRKITNAAAIVGLTLLDHLIVTPGGYVSIRERNPDCLVPRVEY